jgi:hypothetical protein
MRAIPSWLFHYRIRRSVHDGIAFALAEKHTGSILLTGTQMVGYSLTEPRILDDGQIANVLDGGRPGNARWAVLAK